MHIQEAIEKLEGGSDLTRPEARDVMECLLSGSVPDPDIVALLVALRDKGEQTEELIGFAEVMRARAAEHLRGVGVDVDGLSRRDLLVDTCGTGGDSGGTFNISTAAAIVAAAAGARVAKHGNRSVSSRCGSADVLEALGVRIDMPFERIGAAIREVGIGFIFAQMAHRSMRHASEARRQLGGRTIFNLLGPLTNPAGARAQVLGVFSADAVDLVAAALAQLGVTRAFVVHGAGGLDEISLAGETLVADVQEGSVRRYGITPEDFGVRRAPVESLRGGDAAENATLIRRILAGEHGAARDVVVVNAAAALVAAGAAQNFLDGAHLAAEAIRNDAARRTLDALVKFTAG